MNSKDSYTPKEVAEIVGAYSQLVSWDREIGGGRRIVMPRIKEFGETIKECVYIIPDNVVTYLKIKPNKLEESLSATVERSRS